MRNNYRVYILECENNSLYTGITNNIAKRLMAHMQGKASKYTRAFKPKSLWIISPPMSKSHALKAEYEIKQCKSREMKAIYINTLWRGYIWAQTRGV